MEAMIKETGAYEVYKHFTLVIIIELNGKKAIISIWSFTINRDPYGSLIKHKSRLCAHKGMQQWGVNYWETYTPVVNLMSIRAMLTLSILIELHTKSIYFFWPTQADVNIEISMELTISFLV